jgi:putative hemolysin
MMETIVKAGEKVLITEEINGLEARYKLSSRKNFDVFLAPAEKIPHTLQEIGRLRELTFREVGEGTGLEVDIDWYDSFYSNLFIWDRLAEKIVGGYRVGCGKDIFAAYGIDGFYISSLFHIQQGAYPIMEQCIELGRSYVVPEYQKGYLPLFLLWQGILIFLMRNKQYRYLIGPVSISKYYSDTSRSLMVQFVKKHFFNHQLAKYFRPRTPFKPEVEHLNIDRINGTSLSDLEALLATIEPVHIKVPVLLKQYTKINARFISFNLDPKFSDALDGLMVLDLAELPPSMIQLLQEK